MPSDRRLHPLSILFNIGRQFGAIALPLVLIVVGRGTDEDRWNIYALVFLIPYTAIAVGRYLSFRYRYEDSDLVIRRGFIFRNQRHIPYSRIQNIDAVQNVVHRLAGVVDVKIQTGGGSEPEATLSVLTLADLDEMRRRVFATRTGGCGCGGGRSCACGHCAGAVAPQRARARGVRPGGEPRAHRHWRRAWVGVGAGALETGRAVHRRPGVTRSRSFTLAAGGSASRPLMECAGPGGAGTDCLSAADPHLFGDLGAHPPSRLPADAAGRRPACRVPAC